MPSDPRPVPVPTPTDADLAPDALASLGPRTWLLTGAVLGVLRQHFGRRDSIADPVLRPLVWAPDPALPAATARDAPLVIEAATRWDPALAGTRPALVVRREAWSIEGLGIGDGAHMGGRGVPAGTAYTVDVRGAHTVRVIHATGDGAEHLAEEVASLLLEFAPAFRRDLRLKQFRPGAIGPPTPAAEAEGSTAVEIPLAYAMSRTWTLVADLPPIKVVEFDFDPPPAGPGGRSL